MSDKVISTSETAGGQGEEQYGVSNLEYDIITTMGNLLQSQEVLARYAQDAEQAGDMDCATLFRELREGNRHAVGQFRNALARHLAGNR